MRRARNLFVSKRPLDPFARKANAILHQVRVPVAPDAENRHGDRWRRGPRGLPRPTCGAIPVQAGRQCTWTREILDVSIGVGRISGPRPEQFPVVTLQLLLSV